MKSDTLQDIEIQVEADKDKRPASADLLSTEEGMRRVIEALIMTVDQLHKRVTILEK